MMRKMIFLFLLFPLIGYSLSLFPSIVTIEEPVFLVMKGPLQGAESITFDDSTWRRVSFPTNLKEVIGEAEEYWIRFHLYVPHSLYPPMAIFMGYIYAADAFYLNGNYVDGHGIFTAEKNAHDVLRFYPLFHLKSGQTNVLAWRIMGSHRNYTGPYMFTPKIGPFFTLLWNVYWMDFISILFLVVHGVIAAYLLFFFFNRPAQKDYLTFGIFLLVLIVYYVTRNQLKFFLWRNYTLLKQIEYIAYYLIVPFFLLFIRVCLDDRRKIGKWLQIITFFAAIPGYVFAWGAYWDIQSTYNFSIYQPLMFGSSVVYMIFLLIRHFSTKKEAKFFLGGFIFILLCIIYDIGVARGFIQTLSITPFAFFGFVVFFALVLAARFVQLYSELEDLNKNLEQKVHERTKELEESNERLLKARKQIQFELELAQRIQQSMMPTQFDHVQPLKLYGTYLPMEELGGDFYDVYETDNRYFHFVIADVSGHGVPSALIAMMAKAFINYYSEHDSHPAVVVQSVNRDLCRQLSDVENYLTLFYGVMDMATNTFSYVNAGHVNIFYVTRDGKIKKLSPLTPFLGKFEDLTFKAETLEVSSGDKLILYTDGIPETRNKNNQLFGEGHFMDLIALHYEKSPEELTHLILEELDNFRGTMPYGDDITLLIVEFILEEEGVGFEGDVGKLYEKALISYKNNNLAEAEKILEILLSHHSLSPEDTYRSCILAGNLASQQGKFEQAYIYWKKAFDIHPENKKLRANIEILKKKLEKKD